jgi:hypothetical protein
VAPGGHASLVFDLANWKPVFLDLVDSVVERASEDVGVAAAGPRVGLPVGEQRLVGDQLEVRPQLGELTEPGVRTVDDLQQVAGECWTP